MHMLTVEKLIIALKKLSARMVAPDDAFRSVVSAAKASNAWFTEEEIGKALLALHNMLNEKDLKIWFEDISVSRTPKKVGLILAGNIPLVGFHDVLCVLCTGNIAQIKLSSSDEKLLPALLGELIKIEPELSKHIQYVDRLVDFDAIIATGSNNTSRYFEYYFGKVPNIIRKNRNSVAVLTGKEQSQEIQRLGHDIFDYFGLGCRNVSKLYIPEDYDIKNFFEPLQSFQPIFNHFKYNNNYDYNKSVYLVNMVDHFDNGFVLLKEDEQLASPLAVLHYERYSNLEQVGELLIRQKENIQCVIGNITLHSDIHVVNFGESQQPKLWDYADNVNTVGFLQNIV